MRPLTVRALVLSLLATVVAIGQASAGPVFKGGRITWSSVTTRRVEFVIESSFRRDVYTNANGHCVNPVTLAGISCSGADGRPEVGDVIVESEGDTTFNAGDGTPAIASPLGSLLYLVTSVDKTANLFYGSALDPASLPAVDTNVTHTYASAGVFRAFLSGSGRMAPTEGPSVHVNNGALPYRLETLVNVGAVGASPLSAVPPIVKCGIDEVCDVRIGSFDPNRAGLAYRMSGDFESGADQFVQPGPPHATDAADVNSSGRFTWDTTGAELAPPGGRTFYSSQVTIGSLTPAISGSIPPPVTGAAPVSDTIASKIALDFLIELVQASGAPPAFVSGPIGGARAIQVGKEARLAIDGRDPDTNQTLTMSAYGLPGGAQFVTISRGNLARGQFAWKPTTRDVGYHQILFVLNDSGNRQTFGTIVIKVEPAPPAPPAADAAAADPSAKGADVDAADAPAAKGAEAPAASEPDEPEPN